MIGFRESGAALLAAEPEKAGSNPFGKMPHDELVVLLKRWSKEMLEPHQAKLLRRGIPQEMRNVPDRKQRQAQIHEFLERNRQKLDFNKMAEYLINPTSLAETRRKLAEAGGGIEMEEAELNGFLEWYNAQSSQQAAA